MNYLIEQKDGILLRIHVQPRASKNEIVGIHGDRLKILLKAPPVDGEANAELIRYLSEILSIPKGRIEIISGLSGRQKTVRITGITKKKWNAIHTSDSPLL